MLGAIAVAGFAYLLLVFDPNAWGAGQAAPWLGVALRALISSGLFLCWCDFFGELPFTLAIVSIAFTFVAAPVMDLVVLALPQDSLFGVCLLLPLLSVISLHAPIHACPPTTGSF